MPGPDPYACECGRGVRLATYGKCLDCFRDAHVMCTACCNKSPQDGPCDHVYRPECTGCKGAGWFPKAAHGSPSTSTVAHGQTRTTADGKEGVHVFGAYGFGSGGTLFSVSFPHDVTRPVEGMSEQDIATRYPVVIIAESPRAADGSCEARTDAEKALSDLVELVEMDAEASQVGSALWLAVTSAKEILRRRSSRFTSQGKGGSDG